MVHNAVLNGLSSESVALWQLPSERTRDSGSSESSGSSRRRSPVSTRHILQRFQGDTLSETAASQRRLWKEERAKADKALERLVLAAEPSKLGQALRNLFAFRPSVSRVDDLKQDWQIAVNFHAPPRSRVPVYVTDFGRTSSNHYTGQLGKVEQYFQGKPESVQFRWIHIPIDRGLLQSTIEDIFNYTGSQRIGKPFLEAGTSGWPYPTIVTLSFCSQQMLQARTAARKTLSELDSQKNTYFSIDPLDGLSPRQKGDLEWRIKWFDKEISHWDLLEADFPSVLEQPFFSQNSPLNPDMKQASLSETQALAMHQQFAGTLLMANALRAFHRNDGYILTFSGLSGVNYLGEDFRECLASSPEGIISDPEASIFGHTFEAFRDTGTSKWERPTAEWLIIYLFTEAAITPHNIRHGHNTLSCVQCFVAIAKELEHTRKPFARGDRTKLVSQYVGCVRNLKALRAQTQNQEDVIERLMRDWERFEKEYDVERVGRSMHPDAESAKDRLHWAKGILSEHSQCINHLLIHFEDSLKIVFQQQSIELNELAIVEDSQNSAILIFATVTVVFLPLSFLTSYFGMNIRGIADTDRNETSFWKICITFAISLLVVVFMTAYKKTVVRHIRQLHTSAKGGLFAFQGLPLDLDPVSQA